MHDTLVEDGHWFSNAICPVQVRSHFGSSPSLGSLSWREKWQWANDSERRLFRRGLGLTSAEVRQLNRRMVWKTPPRSFIKGGMRGGSVPGRKRKRVRAGPSEPHRGAKATPGKAQDDQGHEWPCSVCQAIVVAKTKQSLTKLRDNHINRCHGGLPRSLVPTLDGQMGSNRSQTRRGGAKRDRQGRLLWKCDVCATTLKHAALTPLRGLRTHHIKVAHPGMCGSCFSTVGGNRGRQTHFDQGKLRQLLEDPAKVKANLDGRRQATSEDGDIESHPGPCSVRLYTMNVNSASNAFNSLSIFAAEGADFIATRLQGHQLAAFARSCDRLVTGASQLP